MEYGTQNTRMWTIKYQNKNTKIDLSSTIMNRFLKFWVFWKAERVLFHLVTTVLWSHASLVQFGGLMDDIWFWDHLFLQIFRYSKSGISLIWSPWPMKFGTKLNMALKNNSKLWMVFSRWWCGLGVPKWWRKKSDPVDILIFESHNSWRYMHHVYFARMLWLELGLNLEDFLSILKSVHGRAEPVLHTIFR